MCDWIDGEILLSFPKTNTKASDLMRLINSDSKPPYILDREELEIRLKILGIEPDPHDLMSFYKLTVPIGQELWCIGELYREYAQIVNDGGGGQQVLELNIGVNAEMHLAASHASGSQLQYANFKLTKTHDDYKALVNLPIVKQASHPVVKVAIVDSGIAAGAGVSSAHQLNLLDTAQKNAATDTDGHGTAIFKILQDIVPDAELFVYKIAEAGHRLSEWDTLAGLAAATGVHVINLSVAFGLADKSCGICGKESHSSKSSVFESMVKQLENRPEKPAIVVAAGNNNDPDLDFPSRFGQSIAIGSITKSKGLSSFSNHGNKDAEGLDHQRHFVAPGGENSTASPEWSVEETRTGASYSGTSFATAYATGVVAASLAINGLQKLNDGTIYDELRSNVDITLTKVSSFDDTYGKGLLVVP